MISKLLNFVKQTIHNTKCKYGDRDQFDILDICPVCTGLNTISNESHINYQICECNTICEKCGHEDYWSCGHFNSSGEPQ